MDSIASGILKRHRNSLSGQLRLERFRSKALGIYKNYYCYLPPGKFEKGNLLFLFRGHEREWVYMHEDGSRIRSTFIEDVDALIAQKRIPPMVILMPGLNSNNNHIPSLGFNMVGKWNPRVRGLGSGRFLDFLTNEFIPYAERKYSNQHGSLKICAGFSIGGFIVSLLSALKPGYFNYAGIFDGLIPWIDHNDPRLPENGMNDKIWLNTSMFDAALGRDRNPSLMYKINSVNIIQNFNEAQLAEFKKTTFFIRSAPGDGLEGNKDRAFFFKSFLAKKNVRMFTGDIILHKEARHNWHWNDYFTLKFLNRVFGSVYV